MDFGDVHTVVDSERSSRRRKEGGLMKTMLPTVYDHIYAPSRRFSNAFIRAKLLLS